MLGVRRSLIHRWIAIRSSSDALQARFPQMRYKSNMLSWLLLIIGIVVAVWLAAYTTW
jgi:hypothetical protein